MIILVWRTRYPCWIIVYGAREARSAKLCFLRFSTETKTSSEGDIRAYTVALVFSVCVYVGTPIRATVGSRSTICVARPAHTCHPPVSLRWRITGTFNHIVSFRPKVETSTHERDEFLLQGRRWQPIQTIMLRQGACSLESCGIVGRVFNGLQGQQQLQLVFETTMTKDPSSGNIWAYLCPTMSFPSFSALQSRRG